MSSDSDSDDHHPVASNASTNALAAPGQELMEDNVKYNASGIANLNFAKRLHLVQREKRTQQWTQICGWYY